MKSNNVIVIVISHKPELSDSELISLKQCHKILGNYRIIYVCPSSLKLINYHEISADIEVLRIHDRWQSTYENFNKLKKNFWFYLKFINYDYILFYEPDAYVFKDELMDWCGQGYSFIGAPWVERQNNHLIFNGVGNGGFSLRKTKDHLKVLLSFRFIVPPKVIMSAHLKNRRHILSKFIGLVKANYFILFKNNYFFLFNGNKDHEDIFFGLFASKKFKWFKFQYNDATRYRSISRLKN